MGLQSVSTPVFCRPYNYPLFIELIIKPSVNIWCARQPRHIGLQHSYTSVKRSNVRRIFCSIKPDVLGGIRTRDPAISSPEPYQLVAECYNVLSSFFALIKCYIPLKPESESVLYVKPPQASTSANGINQSRKFNFRASRNIAAPQSEVEGTPPLTSRVQCSTRQ